MLYLYNIICKYTLLFIHNFHKKITYEKKHISYDTVNDSKR